MRYVGPLGIPLSTFLSWDHLDQEAALSWQAHESARCSSCGSHPDEGLRHPEWWQCPGCAAAEALTAAAGDDVPKGMRITSAAGPRGACPTCNPTRR